MALINNQSHMIEMKVLETVRHLSGVANNFVGESAILNALTGFTQGGIGPDAVRMSLSNLVRCNRMEVFAPVTQMCGSGCGTGCGSCGSCGCGGCGRYYRVKIG